SLGVYPQYSLTGLGGATPPGGSVAVNLGEDLLQFPLLGGTLLPHHRVRAGVGQRPAVHEADEVPAAAADAAGHPPDGAAPRLDDGAPVDEAVGARPGGGEEGVGEEGAGGVHGGGPLCGGFLCVYPQYTLRSGLDVNLHARLEEGHPGAALVGDPDVEGVAGADLGGLAAENQVAVDGHTAGLDGGVDGGSDVCNVLAGDRGLHGSSLALCVPPV